MEDEKGENNVCGNIDSQNLIMGEQGLEVTVTCPYVLKGRYVKIQRSVNGVLAMREVYVFGFQR